MHEKHGNFLQGPLSIFANRNRPFSELVDDFFDHGLVNFIDKTNGEKGCSFDKMTASQRQTAIEKSRSIIEFSGGSADRIRAGYTRAWNLEFEWRKRFGRTCLVRLRTDLIFSARNGELTERQARILFGLYSAIGDKPFVKATWQGIQHRAAGWVRSNAMSRDADFCGPIYSRGQIDRTLIELMDRGLVVGATYNGGERFWSHSLTEDGLWAKITERKLNHLSGESARQLRNLERSKALGLVLAKRATPMAATPW